MACAQASIRMLAKTNRMEVSRGVNSCLRMSRASGQLKLPAANYRMQRRFSCTGSPIMATAKENTTTATTPQQQHSDADTQLTQESKPSISISPTAKPPVISQAVLGLMDDQFDPFRATTSTMKYMLDLMDRLVTDNPSLDLALRRAPWDAAEDDESYKVRIDIPGFGKDEVKVHVEDAVLVIDAQKSKEDGDHDEQWTSRAHSSFHTRLALPKNVDPNNVSAKMKYGVLEVTIPKTKVHKQVQEVKVE